MASFYVPPALKTLIKEEQTRMSRERGETDAPDTNVPEHEALKELLSDGALERLNRIEETR